MRLKTIMGLLVPLFISRIAFAFYTVQETGDLLKPDEKQAAATMQMVTSGDTGINLIGRLDMGYNDDSNIRFMAGAGTTDFEIGAFYKIVPFPDYEKQPAIGFTFGAHFAHYNSNDELSMRVIPFASKKFDVKFGTITPYASLPFAFSNYNKSTYEPLQLVIGSRYKHPDFDTCEFNVELGFNVSSAFSYIAVGAVFPAFN